MLFNSIEFAIFLPIVFSVYWLIGRSRLRAQNFFLLVASYLFYGWWDWRFLTLIAFSSFVDYGVGRLLGVSRDPQGRRLLLACSIVANLGLLGFFKYYDFFAHNMAEGFTLLGRPLTPSSLSIVLPVGISFYTFQSLSYTIDVYWRKLEPTQNAVDFLAFVSFFPQLVAGPIERATHLLPQFRRQREFDYARAVDGLRQILWGLFKKIVIADNCAVLADTVFGAYQTHTGSTLMVGTVFFALQIYGDFSGYSDIAIGSARLFGFDLKRNFAVPYFSRDIAEFWRRWHISLSTWFRDYVYLPLGGSRSSTWRTVRNTFVVFVVSGFWHGASWTFVAWGALNACYFLLLRKRNRKHTDTVAAGSVVPSMTELAQMASTFALTLVAWVFFRSPSVTDAVLYLYRMCSVSVLSVPEMLPSAAVAGLIGIFVLVEWVQREKAHGLQLELVRVSPLTRWAVCYSVLAAILFYGGDQRQFIYFQF
jgi:D-alanyl-lipoteichoic acid acyltransferase DltB (MBOAT superfamily)